MVTLDMSACDHEKADTQLVVYIIEAPNKKTEYLYCVLFYMDSFLLD